MRYAIVYLPFMAVANAAGVLQQGIAVTSAPVAEPSDSVTPIVLQSESLVLPYSEHSSFQKRSELARPDFISPESWEVLNKITIHSVLSPAPEQGSEEGPGGYSYTDPVLIQSSAHGTVTVTVTSEPGPVIPGEDLPSALSAQGLAVEAPLPDFDPFNDLNKEDTSLYTNSQSLADFFRLTPDNLAASRAQEWYAQWTLARQSSEHWGPSGRGEWPMFVEEFTGSPNLQCNLEVACRIDAGLTSLFLRYQKNPELVRRIYFIQTMMMDSHDIMTLELKGFERATIHAVTQLPDVIKKISPQADSRAIAACKLVHAFRDSTVAIGISAVNGLLNGMVSPFLQKGAPLGFLIQQFGKDIKGANGKGKKMSMNFSSLIMGLFTKELWSYRYWDKMNNELNGYSPVGKVDGGKGTDDVCSWFQGDFHINTDANIHAMTKVIGDEMLNVHRELKGAYRAFFNGEYVIKGQMSPTAEMFMKQQWVGDHSVASKISNTDEFEADIESRLLFKTMSIVASGSHQYLKCTDDMDAPKLCALASQQGKPDIFCPRPETNPYRICSAAMWYYAVGSQKELQLPHIDSWKHMFGSRREEVFKWSAEKMLMSIYDHYENYGNDFDSPSAVFDVAGTNTSSTTGLQIPVCYNLPGTKGGVESGLFPVACGHDYRASEVEPFMDRLGMGIKSKVHKDLDYARPNILWTEYIPRALGSVFPPSISPVSRYLSMCHTGVRFADWEKDCFFGTCENKTYPFQKFSIHTEKDKDCEVVERKPRA